jgi:putative ABC transport system permease protein
MAAVTRSDFRAAVRGLIRTPTVTLSAVLCLALGIGATTAIASAIHRALLTPLPFRAPDRLIAVFRTTPVTGPGGTWPESAPNYLDLARTTRRLTDLAAINGKSALVTIHGRGAQARVEIATGNLFPMLGVAAEHGRVFGPADDHTDQPAVAVVSDEYWHSALGADPAIVGSTIAVDGTPTTIIGVAPPRFRVPIGAWMFQGDLWMPIRFTADQLAQRGSNNLMMIGRLAKGATPATAQTELKTLFAGLVSAYPDLRGEDLRTESLQPASVSQVRTPLLMLFGAVALVLLIAASNVAALLLARGVGRRLEMAVRTSLGATRWDAMRIALVESLLITVAGALFGIALAELGVVTIGRLAAKQQPQLAGLGLDMPVIAFGLGLAFAVALVCGAVPAWRSASVDPQNALRASRGTSREQHRSLRSLVVFEIGLSVVLVIAAGLVLKGFARLLSNDPGFETDHVLTLAVTAPATSYADSIVTRRFLHPVLDGIAEIPGVASVGAVSSPPFVRWGQNGSIHYEGRPLLDPSKEPLVEDGIVTPGYFAVTAQRLLSGRLLRASDDERPTSPPVVVVNKALADRDFKGRDPVGSRFNITDSILGTIVGVVSDVRNFGPISPTVPEMYWPYDQWPGGYNYPLMVRVKGNDPAAVAKAIEAVVHRIDPDAAVADVETMRQVIANDLGRPRFYLGLLGTFAAVALVLALAGLYGVLGYVVAQRTKELGIRAALGSSTRSLMALVTRDGLRMIGGGMVLGAAGGWAATRVIAFMLYGVSPLDVPTWIGALVTMLAAGAAVTLIPAVRAARSDPIIAMRSD